MVRGCFSLVVTIGTLLSSLAVQAADPACVGWIGVDSGAQPGAEIVLDGAKRAELTPTTLKDIPCGKHQLVVQKALFKAEKRAVEVKAGDVAKVAVDLVSNAGSLDVSSEPAGAEIFIDGKSVGQAPLKLVQVEAGKREVEARLADHASAKRNVVIKAGKAAALKLSLKAVFGMIRVSVKPAGEFIVWLDGDPLGPAPLELNRVTAGEHQLKLTSELYAPYETKLRIKAGQTASVKATPRPNFGTVVIESKPAGARIRVGERELGEAPVTVRLPPGTHPVLAIGAEPTHGRLESKVQVKKGARRKLVLQLPVKVGQLMIDSVPFAAAIEIDGKKRGKAPLSLKDMPVGVHVLKASAPKLMPLHGRILVVEGQRSVVELNLQDPNKSKFESPPAPVEPVAAAVVPAAVKKAPAPVKPKDEPKKVAQKKATPQKKSTAPAGDKGSSKEPEKKEAVADPDLEKVLAKNDESAENAADTEVSAQAAAPVSFQRIAAWGTGGLAIAAAVTGVVMTGLGYATEVDADDAYKRWLADQTAESERKFRNLDEKTADYKNAAWGLFGCAAAVGAVSVILFLTEPEPDVDVTGPQDGFRIAPLRGGGGYLGYEMRF